MCAIIFVAKHVEESWVLGFDACSKWIGDEEDIASNTGGLGKRHPKGPACTVRGVQVPTFCCASENGSITATLLVEMLRTIDSLGFFARSDGIPPFLLVDGHGSLFDLEVLNYVSSSETEWNVCIGLPYGASYWQFGDSSEQNGSFKMSFAKHKRKLLAKKEERRQRCAIENNDVAFFVHQAWMDSFAQSDTIKKSIADRGWNPLNYNCLCRSEIVATKLSREASTAFANSNSDVAETLNLISDYQF